MIPDLDPMMNFFSALEREFYDYRSWIRQNEDPAASDADVMRQVVIRNLEGSDNLKSVAAVLVHVFELNTRGPDALDRFVSDCLRIFNSSWN